MPTLAGKALLGARPRVAAAAVTLHTLPRSRAPGASALRLGASSAIPRPAAVAPAAQARALSFSFPGPRKLGDIANLPLLEKVRAPISLHGDQGTPSFYVSHQGVEES